MGFLPPAPPTLTGVDGVLFGKFEFSLAGITFKSYLFEVPQDLVIGLETWGSIHKLPQTGTSQPKMIAQTFGVFPKPIEWEARFLGKDAETKSRTLAAAQQQQRVVPFTVGARSWDVVIWEYTETIRSRYDIGFKIHVKPLAERSGRTPTSTSSVDASANLQTQLRLIQTLMKDPSALDPRASSIFSAITSLIQSIQAIIPETLAGVAPLFALYNQFVTTINAIQSLQTTLFGSTASTDWQVYLWLAVMLSAVKSYQNTLGTLIGTDAFVTVKMRSGDNLFAVAATQLGDWTRALDIMQTNGLSDVFASNPQTVTIPRI